MTADARTCSSCGHDISPGVKFCGECGALQALACPSCASAVQPGQRFCMECGTPLGGESAASRPTPVAASGPARAERRLVTVLFADLVAYTTLSEHRDSEVVREMLEEYFDRCRTIIGRYGGVVEKFIGDAVMAVWGTPVAREDDAERAVRAGLELIGAVQQLGEHLGMPELCLRVGLLTGEAAVNRGAEHEGMVIGDVVNTASRIQSLAEPGAVYVEEATRRATGLAIQYEDAGSHQVKGREQQVHVYKALRVLGGVGGSGRGSGLEAPFVGRDRELHAILDGLEAVTSERRARLVTIIGEAGMGKSRLAWEFEKRVDGIADTIFWHRGRSLSYGEGVSFWALAEVVRSRARIVEGESAASARDKLRACVDEYVPEERERRLTLPRLEHLLGLAEGAGDSGDLFSAWRLFFERLADVHPVVIIFEDLHWADSGLLEFIDHLVEWASESPILVVALARPEALERRPSWTDGAHQLQPLPDDAMDELLHGLVPGLPAQAAERIRARADGIPLYAVETVRMMLDCSVLEQHGDVYVVTGDVDDVQIPETLHALVGSRLDGLAADERSLIQDASVLGQSFSAPALAALAGIPEPKVDALLASLVAKQVLEEDRDPLSPERGQFGFVQALLKTVAYGTLGRQDRKARHLAAADVLEQASRDAADDVAEFLATHYVEAVRADPDAADAPALRDKASSTLTDAGARAMSLGLGSEARRWYERAAELSDDPAREAALLGLAGRGGMLAADDDAHVPFEQAAGLLDALGDRRAAAVLRARAAEQVFREGRFADHAELLAAILDEVRVPEVDADMAYVASWLARSYINGDEAVKGLPHIDVVLVYAERAGDVVIQADALVTRGTLLCALGRPCEGLGLTRLGRELALAHDLSETALRAYQNPLRTLTQQGRYGEAIALADEGLALAERVGDRIGVWGINADRSEAMLAVGRWDEVAALPARFGANAFEIQPLLVAVHHARGDEPAARAAAEAAAGTGHDEVSLFGTLKRMAAGSAALAAGEYDTAITVLLQEFEDGERWLTPPAMFSLLLDASVAANRPEAAAQAIARWRDLGAPFASSTREATIAYYDGRMARRRDDASAEADLTLATEHARAAGDVFLLGRCLVELGDLLLALRRGTDAEPLLDEARDIFVKLKATPWIARVDGTGPRSGRTGPVAVG